MPEKDKRGRKIDIEQARETRAIRLLRRFLQVPPDDIRGYQESEETFIAVAEALEWIIRRRGRVSIMYDTMCTPDGGLETFQTTTGSYDAPTPTGEQVGAMLYSDFVQLEVTDSANGSMTRASVGLRPAVVYRMEDDINAFDLATGVGFTPTLPDAKGNLFEIRGYTRLLQICVSKVLVTLPGQIRRS